MKPEALARDRWLAAVGTLPGVMVYRSEVIRGAQHQLSLPVGHPDCVLCAGGVVVLVEWKAPSGRLRPEQERFRDAWRAAGGHWLLARDPGQCCLDLAGMVQEPARSELLNAAEKMHAGVK